MKRRNAYTLVLLVICGLSQLAAYGENHAVGSEQRSRRSRPEERGVSLNKRTTAEVVEILKGSQDRIMLRKAAKAMGDRSLDAHNRFTEAEKKAVRETSENYLKRAKAAKADDRVEARHQIERLWHAAVPALLDNMDSKEPAVAELAIKSLILMRNEEIVKALVDKARSAKDQHSKAMAIFTLKKMKEERKSLITDRECMDKEASVELYDRLIVPALAELDGGVEAEDATEADHGEQISRNLKKLENAKQLWAMQHEKGPQAKPQNADIKQHLVGELKWPEGCVIKLNEVSKPCSAIWQGREYSAE